MTYARLSAWLAALGATIFAFFVMYEPGHAFAAVLFLAVALGAIAIAPRRLGFLSWSAGIPVFYVVFFLLMPVLSGADAGERIAPALLVASAGLAAFAFGVFAMRLVPAPASYDMFGLMRWDLSRKPYTIATLILLGSAALLWSYTFGYFGLNYSPDAVGPYAGLISTASFLLVIGHVMAWTSYTQTRKRLLLGLVSTALLIAFGVLSNSKERMLLPFFYIAVCMWGATGKFPYKLFIVSVLLYVFVAFPFVTATRVAQVAELSGERVELAGVMTDYLLSMQWLDDAAEFNPFKTMDRGLLSYFALIVSQAGNHVPFLEGRTFVEAFETLVPRFIDPDKTDISIAHWTAQMYGVIGEYDEGTSVAPSYMGEFYMNFGLAGVCAGMFLVGVLAMLIDRYAIVSRRSWTMPIMVHALIWQASFVGHTIIPFVKTAVLAIPALLLIAYFLRQVRSISEFTRSQPL